jgi:hypothetical protein
LKGSFLGVFDFGCNRNLDGGMRILYWRDFQHSNKPFVFVILPGLVRPGISPFGLGVPNEIEHFHDALPNGSPLESFLDRDGLDMLRVRFVQVENDLL